MWTELAQGVSRPPAFSGGPSALLMVAAGGQTPLCLTAHTLAIADASVMLDRKDCDSRMTAGICSAMLDTLRMGAAGQLCAGPSRGQREEAEKTKNMSEGVDSASRSSDLGEKLEPDRDET